MTELARLRNFSIVAHIDHGKSTLADRIIERCGALEAREMRGQVLDSMDLERERGITIKAQTVRLKYTAADGFDYIFNLIDTPGHVDFSYEVSRSMRACEGSLLLVDATQGVEAQTLANAYQAIDADHEIVVVLNKIDLPAAEPDKMKAQIEDILGLDASDALLISAKTGDGVDAVMEAIVQRLPPPAGDVGAPLKALVVDSWYDPYLGVVTLVRVKEGRLQKGMRARFMGTSAVHPIDRVGVFSPKPVVFDEPLGPGEVGFITAGIKDIADAQVGDTITDDRNPADAPLPGFRPSQPVVFCGMFPADGADYPALRDALGKLRLNDSSFAYEPENSQALGFGFRCGFLGLLHLEIIQARLDREFDLDLVLTAPSVVYRLHQRDGTETELHNPADAPLPGFRPSQPVVFCGMFPADGADYPALRDALGKLRLNDSSFAYEPENSQALGFGFRCGFLGLLHLEIIQARLDREFDLDLVLTAPSVVYRLHQRDGTETELHNPADFPDPTQIDYLEEPWIKATIILPDDYLGPVLQLCTEKRGIQDELTYVGSRAMVVYRLPLNEVVYDFYDRLKSISRGYASFDYEMVGFDRSDLVKLDILINGDRVDSLALLVHRSMAEMRGRALCERLQELIPRQQYQVAIQAAIGGKVIARETVKAMRKDVLAKCYGGDVTRKRKLLEKQKAGKKRMRQFGKIEIPQEAFLAALKMET